MITVDANIYVSAIVFRGNPGRLLHRAIEGDVQAAISQPILDEVLRVLRVKFGRSEADLDRVESLIGEFARMVAPAITFDVVNGDPDNNRIVECAV